MIDFEKLLFNEFKIKYGPKDSYCNYPREYKTRGLLDGNIIPISFIIKYYKGNKYIQIKEGAVTGYESALINDLLSLNNDWTVNVKSFNYPELIIKQKDLQILLNEICQTSN